MTWLARTSPAGPDPATPSRGTAQAWPRPGGYDELAAIACDPVMRGHARRVAGDLAEDALQETWYAVAQARARGPIANLRGYFYRALVNTARRMREEVGRLGTPAGDLAAAGALQGRLRDRGVGGERRAAPPARRCSQRPAPPPPRRAAAGNPRVFARPRPVPGCHSRRGRGDASPRWPRQPGRDERGPGSGLPGVVRCARGHARDDIPAPPPGRESIRQALAAVIGPDGP